MRVLVDLKTLLTQFNLFPLVNNKSPRWTEREPSWSKPTKQDQHSYAKYILENRASKRFITRSSAKIKAGNPVERCTCTDNRLRCDTRTRILR